jgi:hypothetical protein
MTPNYEEMMHSGLGWKNEQRKLVWCRKIEPSRLQWEQSDVSGAKPLLAQKSDSLMAFFSKIYGTAHKNTNGGERQSIIKRYCRPGMRHILRPEPENKFDAYAIGIWLKVRVWLMFQKELQLGYINRDLSEELSKFILNGGELIATISDVTGGGRKTYGINIEIDKR